MEEINKTGELAEQNKESYKTAFKATSIFGGVQIFNILIAIIRSKIVAILLGPSGMGIMSLFTTTLGLVTGITNVGLGTAAVKNIAAADTSGDHAKLAKTVTVFRTLVWLTGGLGFVLTLVFAPLLSELAFGNKAYTFAFVILSITLLFSQLTAGQNAILQGTRKIQYLAMASMLGALGGLLISIPLYYFFKKDGIVPAIVITSIFTLVLTWYFARKIKIEKATVSRHEQVKEGKGMLQFGFLISMSGMITLAVAYILQIYISNQGSLSDVGLFTAGFAIINTYVGMVFTAMGTDYYPRLSALADDNAKCRTAVNQQAEIAVLILAPILLILLVFVQVGIVLLYSKEFIGVVGMIHWATLGIFFKALSWSIAFVFLAKSASKVFFWNELISSCYMLLFNVTGYYFGGLEGLGISFFISYIAYFFQVLLVTKKLYNFQISNDLLTVFVVQFTIAIICLLIVLFTNTFVSYSVGLVLIVVSAWFSWNELDKRIGIKQIIKNRLNKK